MYIKKIPFVFVGLVIGLGSPLLAVASPNFFAAGTSATMGHSSIGHHLLSVSNNPAAAHLVVAEKDTFRMGFLSSAGVSIEYGDIDNFQDELDDILDLLDEGNVTLQDADSTVDRFNTVLESMGDSGYFRFGGGIRIPGLPVVFRSQLLKGTMTVDASMDFLAKGSVLDSPLSFAFNNANVEFQTNSSLYLKGASLLRVGVGYSRPVWAQTKGQFQGQLIAGTRFNVYSMELSKQIIGFETIGDDEVSDIVKDEYDKNQVSSSAVGLDAGVIWQARRYQVGLTLSNLNQPSFEYGSVGINCDTLTAAARDNCFIAQTNVNSGRIKASEEHEMSILGTIDAAFYVMPNWSIATSYDVADYNDPVGDEVQYFSVSTTHTPLSRWIPAWRVGYRANLAGEKLSQLGLGTTLFGIFNLDMAYGLESTSIDGSSAPRSLGFSFGFEQRL